MKATKQVVLGAMVVILGVSILNAQSNKFSRLDATNMLRDILLAPGKVGDMPIEDQIKKWLIKPRLMDETNVVALLIGWASSDSADANKIQRRLADAATGVLGAFPSEATRRTLLAIANGTNADSRVFALGSLVKSSPGFDLDKSLDGVWFSSLGYQERLTIYEVYISKAEAMTNKVENIQQFVDVMERLFENHSSRLDGYFLDRYLTKKIPSHRMKPRRQEWLKSLKESHFEDVRKYAEQELIKNIE